MYIIVWNKVVYYCLLCLILIGDINALDVSINIDDIKITILLYADNNGINDCKWRRLTENVNYSQQLVYSYELNVNINKSKIMHWWIYGWKLPSVKPWTRCSNMSHDRINLKVLKWSIKKAVLNKSIIFQF